MLAIGKQSCPRVFYFSDDLLVLLPARFVLILKYFKLFDDLTEIDQSKSF